jgi:hypothetical protein
MPAFVNKQILHNLKEKFESPQAEPFTQKSQVQY